MAEGGCLDSEYKCAICLSVYTEPRLLPCYHVFCTPCLDDLDKHNDSWISCPLCRTKIIVPEDEIEGFQLYNFSVNPKDSRESGIKELCHLCSAEKYAVAKCIECDSNLCLECREYHGKLKSSELHTYETFQDTENKDSTGSKVTSECDKHKKALDLFCKSCNQLICSDCRIGLHKLHKVQSVNDLATIKRDALAARKAILKGRISIIENSIENATLVENNCFKTRAQVKKEIKSHTTSLKEVFCRMVDILAKQSSEFVDEVCKANIKIIQTYKEELETEKMSIHCLTRTVEKLLVEYSDEQLSKESFNLVRQMDRILQKNEKNMPQIQDFKYKWGEFKEETVKKLFGDILLIPRAEAVKSTFPSLQLPDGVKAQRINGFKVTGSVCGIIPGDNDCVWIWNDKKLILYCVDGTVKKQMNVPDRNKKILRKSRNDISCWTGNSVILSGGKECYKVSFEGGAACGFIHTGNLLVYNPEEKNLYEITEQNDVQRKISNKKLKSMLTEKDMILAETKNYNLAMSQNGPRVIIADSDGYVLNLFAIQNATFKSICTDNYGNIIVADYTGNFIVVLSEVGEFQCYLLVRNDDIYDVTHLAVDECGHLWFSHKNNNLRCYDYQL